jgi:protein-histidine pros-kinase
MESAVADLLDEPSVGGIVFNTRDITERTLAEQTLRENNMELERLSRAKDTFLASMSHELRTPLNAIIGFAGTLLMGLPGPLTADQERQLQIVERSGKHLLAIINDMLDLTKIEAGELRVEFSPVQCVELVRGVVQTLQPLADEKDITLTVRLPEAELTLVSDARALQQILINLVSNAVKFTDEGFVHVSLEASPGGGARISVTDSGSGIADDDLAQIFNAFERGANAARRSKEGTGLGLHISRRLAEMIDATIAVRSEVGVGSTFTVALPARAGGAA